MNEADLVNSHQKAYVCIDVTDLSKPILLVSRPEGVWCFLCGGSHPEDPSFYHVAGLHHFFDRDPSLLELSDLPPGWEAERKDAASQWIRTKIDDPDA